MLTSEQIEQNRVEFISLMKKVETRQGAYIDSLLSKLDSSDFFHAPASTQYHCSYEGGLCQHCLNVYNQLIKLIDIEYPKKKVEGENEVHYESTCPYSEETLIIVSLLHDLSKMNFYETYYRNVKDEKGNWKQVPSIKVKEANDRFIYAGHGVNFKEIL